MCIYVYVCVYSLAKLMFRYGLLHCYFLIIIQINWPFYRNHLGQIPLVLALLYGNCPLIFTHTCSFSNYSVLISSLIYRCFVTLYSTRIFDFNFETFCSCKFISCVLKSEYILLNWIELNWIIYGFRLDGHQITMQVVL